MNTLAAPVVAGYPAGSYRFQDDFYTVRPEGRRLSGAVYVQSPQGDVAMKRSLDLPREAVVDNRVVIYLDGIHQSIGEQQRQIRELFSGMDRPVVGIHEGSGKTILHDSHRQASNLLALKSIQTGALSAQTLRSRIFSNDPAVKSVYNLLRQGMDSGTDITLVTHSGGGIEGALALHMLREKGYEAKIGQHVRILSLASGVAPEDFTGAGIKNENLFYTGSKADLAFQLARHFLPVAVPGALGGAVSWMMERPREEVLAHSPDYLFQENGQAVLEGFMQGKTPGKFVEVP